MAKEQVLKAFEMYKNGMKLIEIASQLNVPEGTVRSWKNRNKWDATLQKSKRNVAKRKKGGQPGNKNATGPPGNKNSEKYGFFSKYLPDETKEIFDAISDANPLDLLWHQIQIAYAAIVRAQKISYVKDHLDNTTNEACDKQENFLKAQARAQGELRTMIKQYDEMMHNRWDLATDEQKARIDKIRSDIGDKSKEDKPIQITFVKAGDKK